MNSTPTVALADIQQAVNMSRALIIVILGVLVVTLVVRTAIFFVYRKKITTKSCQNCNCNKQPGVIIQPSFVPVKREKKQTESSSRSSRKSSRKEKKKDETKKKTTTKRTRSDVDLEKGENVVDKSSTAVRETSSSKEKLGETLTTSKEKTGETSTSKEKTGETSTSKEKTGEMSTSKEKTLTSKEEDATAMSPTHTALAASPAPHPLLAGEAPLGEPTPPVAAAVDSLIVCSTVLPLPMPVETPQVLKEPVPHTAGPSISMASTFDNKKNTAV